MNNFAKIKCPSWSWSFNHPFGWRLGGTEWLKDQLQAGNLNFCKIMPKVERKNTATMDFWYIPPFPIKRPEIWIFEIFSCLSNIHNKNKSKIILLIEIFKKKYSKHFQDTNYTINLLDPSVEFVRWCPYFKSGTLKCWHKELVLPNKSAWLEF